MANTFTASTGTVKALTGTPTPDGSVALSGASALAVRKTGGRPRVWAVVGDSRTPFMSADVGGLLLTENGWLVQALSRTGYPASVGYMGGVSGSRVIDTDFSNRVDAACAIDSVTDVLFKGGVNDLNGGVSGATVAQTMIGYIERALTAGKNVWWEEEEGGDELASPTPSNPWLAAETAEMAIYNSIVKQRYKDHSSVRIVSLAPLFVDRSVRTNTFKSGWKYDYLHDSISGADSKATAVIAAFPDAFPMQPTAVIPSQTTYSGIPTTPVQLLSNSGFTTRTGGTIATGATNNGNPWTQGQSVTAGAWRFNAGNFYYATNTGNCGTTAPTHTSGTQSDGTINWTFAVSFGSWTQGQVVVATTSSWAFRINGSYLYYTTTGGTCGSTAPSHTSGTQSDGGVSWTYLMASTNAVPASWGIKPGTANTSTWKCGTIVNADGGIDFCVLAMFGAANQQVDLVTGSDYDASFISRQLPTTKYSLEATVIIDRHVGLKQAMLQWQRGDLAGLGPTDGVTVTNSTYADTTVNSLLTFPRTMRRKTRPFPAAAQNTSNGNVVGNVVTWNNMYVSAVSNGPGWALIRVRDARMIPEA